jgi:hypothetical protein
MQLDELCNPLVLRGLDCFFALCSLVSLTGKCHSMAKRRGGSLTNEHARVQNNLQRTFEIGRNVESERHWFHVGRIKELRSSVDDIQGVKVLLGRALDGREWLRLGAGCARPLALGLLFARAESELLAFVSKVANGIVDGLRRVDVVGVNGSLSGIFASRTANANEGDSILPIASFDGQRGLGGPGHGDCRSVETGRLPQYVGWEKGCFDARDPRRCRG